MKTLEAKHYRRLTFPAGVVLVVSSLNWLPYPMGLRIRVALFGAGIVMIAPAFWAPRAAFRVRTMMAAVA